MSEYGKPSMDAPLPDVKEFYSHLVKTGLPPGPVDRTMDIALGTTAAQSIPAPAAPAAEPKK